MPALTWTSPLGAAGPTADGSTLVFDFECRTSRMGRGRSHPVSIRADWEVTTPHDLESERIAAAFGGYLSCVELVDTVIPAVRDVTQLTSRRILPPVLRDPRSNTWSIQGVAAGCECGRGPFGTLIAAVRHLRGPHHWRRSHAAPDRMFAKVWAEVEGRWPPLGNPRPRDRVRRMVLEVEGFSELWERGLPPEYVELVHHQICGAVGALPQRVYESVAFQGADSGWLREVHASTDDLDAVTWAASTEHIWGSRPRESRLGWLQTGVPRSMIEILMPSSYQLSDVTRTARDFQCTDARAAGILASWVSVGAEPSAEELRALARVPMAGFVPSGASIKSLMEQVKRARLGRKVPQPTHHQAAMMLAAAGNVGEALQRIKRGERIEDHPQPSRL